MLHFVKIVRMKITIQSNWLVDVVNKNMIVLTINVYAKIKYLKLAINANWDANSMIITVIIVIVIVKHD